MVQDLGSLPPSLLVVLGVLALVQLALDVVALVDLARRPRKSVLFANKWVWLAIIVLVNVIGPILYLAVGRTQGSPLQDTWTTPGTIAGTGAGPASSIADELYGRPGDQLGTGESR